MGGGLPWEATLTDGQHALILYFLALSGLALLAGFVRAYVTREEVGPRYRAAVVARLAIMGASSVTYIVLFVMFMTGYDSTDAGWVPNELAINTFAGRYAEWSISVPLLVAELLAVTSLAGAAAGRVRVAAMGSAFFMILTGFVGLIVIDGTAPLSRTGFVIASCVFWIVTTIVLVQVVRASLPSITTESGALLVRATLLLLGGWTVYPLLAMVQIVAVGGEWTTLMQIGFCVADVVVKVGFAGVIHRVAKLRTAEDVRAGEDVHPEAIWIESVKRSDAGLPREVFLPESATIHSPRARPPIDEAVAATPDQAAAIEQQEPQ